MDIQPQKEYNARVKLFGDDKCHKSRLYVDALIERGVEHDFFDVELDPAAARVLRSLFDDGGLKYPTFVIDGRVVRNPPLKELDKILMRQEILPQAVLHEPQGNRFVRYMRPRDSFISYSMRDERYVLTHIEVPEERRGEGLGKALALEVFSMLKSMGADARLQCPYLRETAAMDEAWAEYFQLK